LANLNKGVLVLYFADRQLKQNLIWTILFEASV